MGRCRCGEHLARADAGWVLLAMLRAVAGQGIGRRGRGPVRGPSHRCNQCNQGHRRHGSVVCVQVVRPERRAVLLIIRRRGFEPHPPHFTKPAERCDPPKTKIITVGNHRSCRCGLCQTMSVLDACGPGTAVGKAALRACHTAIRSSIVSPWPWQLRS
jgi:hypothetical protein